MKNKTIIFSLILSLINPIIYFIILVVWANFVGVTSIDDLKSVPIREVANRIVYIFCGVSLLGSVLFIFKSNYNIFIKFIIGFLLINYGIIGSAIANELGIGNKGYLLDGFLRLTVLSSIVYIILFIALSFFIYLTNIKNKNAKI